MKTNIKLGIIAALALATGLQAQPATLASLRSTYLNAAAIITAETHKAQAEAMVRYGYTLEALMVASKQKGDLYTYTAVDAEKTRYLDEKTVPTNTPPAAVADAVALYNKQVQAIGMARDARTIYLLRQYIAALGILTKEMMIQNKIEEAKATSETKSSAEFELAELEAAMPVVVAKTNTVVKVEVPVQEKSIVGKWQVYRPDGTLHGQAEFYKGGRFEVQNTIAWSGTYTFTDLGKTKIKMTYTDGQVKTGVYNKATDVITQMDGYTLRR